MHGKTELHGEDMAEIKPCPKISRRDVRSLVTISTMAVFLLIIVLPIQDVYAVPTIEWRQLGSTISATPINEGNLDSGFAITIRVVDTDGTFHTNGVIDTINVQVTSSIDSTGTALTLTETGVNTGEFENTNFVFMHGNYRFTTGDTGTVTIQDNCDSGSGPQTGTHGNCDTGAVDTLSAASSHGAIIKSDTDTAGIQIDLVETGENTNLFTRTLSFCTASSCSNAATATIEVSDGDIITIVDQVSSAVTNAIIIPAVTNKGAISAEILGTATASYSSATPSTINIQDDGAPGRGGGGLVRPGIEVDSVSSSSPDSTVTGGGCRGDCEPPTLGLSTSFTRIVEKGFSYNDNPVDVELYYTPYPLITVNVGEENKAVFKIYDNSGIHSISNVALAFGLGKGESFGDSKATINLEITFDGSEIVTVYDPENVLEGVDVVTEKDQCNGELGSQCLIVTFYHTFRAPLDFNMVASYVWDAKRNSWQNYFNHGVDVVGESVNAPTVEFVVDRFGKTYALTIKEVAPGIRLDENNSQWILIGDTWYPYTRSYSQIHPETIVDKGTPNSFTRHWDYFQQLKESQNLLAQEELNKILGKNPFLNPYLKEN